VLKTLGAKKPTQSRQDIDQTVGPKNPDIEENYQFKENRQSDLWNGSL
jgi:hypothetical protein